MGLLQWTGFFIEIFFTLDRKKSEKIIILCTLRGNFSLILKKAEILDLCLPVNAPAHYMSPIFMYNVTLRPL